MEAVIDEHVHHLMQRHLVPGMSIAVVRNGSVLLQKGYGVTDLESQTPVTEKTLFCIGSITKSFTSALLASAIQATPGVTWDTPVSQILGESFRFPDEYRTRHGSLRDLLAHKMGIELGETDFIWMSGALTVDDVVQRANKLPIAADFRTKMIYNNLMYSIAGRVAERLAGQGWEELVQERFLDLLGMTDAGFIHRQDQLCSSLAKPHMSARGKLLQLDPHLHRNVDCCGAAGSLVCSAGDMAKWMQLHLDRGAVCGLPVIRPDLLTETHKPQFALPGGKPEWSGFAARPKFPAAETRNTYGMGWYQGTYREYKYIAHAGELFGYDCLMTLYPDVNAGVYIAINGPGGDTAYLICQCLTYFMSDLLLDLQPWLDKDTLCSFPEPWQPRDSMFPTRIHTDIDLTLTAFRPTLFYIGTYVHSFLGSLEITEENGHLTMKYGKTGLFKLHPNEINDEFRLEGLKYISFLHQIDLYSPSDWMLVHFNVVDDTSVSPVSLCCSLFESGPEFLKTL